MYVPKHEDFMPNFFFSVHIFVDLAEKYVRRVGSKCSTFCNASELVGNATSYNLGCHTRVRSLFSNFLHETVRITFVKFWIPDSGNPALLASYPTLYVDRLAANVVNIRC
jgi:hypothetical protein